MTLERGTLVVRLKKGGGQLILVQIGDKPAMNVAQGEVSQSLLDQLSRFHDKEVEFERINGQPKRVREPGGVFVAPSAPTRAGASDSARRNGPWNFHQGSRQPFSGQLRPAQRGRAVPRVAGDFHNPYNFVPAPPRNTSHPELGDHAPVAQDVFDRNRYTGVIRVRMVAKTPLLVPDTSVDAPENLHKISPLRLGADGKPLIPASSVRGMLRSAYEAVTNSRFGRFSRKHQSRLKYRESRPPRKVVYSASAYDLLPESLRPASNINELSPADRVFGWVHADADRKTLRRGDRAAARGLLRVGPVTCESSVNASVMKFDEPGVPLAILSTPKPQQGRFYVAASPNGEAQRRGLTKSEAGYSTGKGLRGRKVYPHQRNLPTDHWNDPMQDRTQQPVNGHYQEYRRPTKNGNEQPGSQNRSILGWVKPGAEFTFDIHVHNLSKVELGALFWLLQLPDDHFFRFGGGKPLGFGSVRLTIDSCDVRTGTSLAARYESWREEPTADSPSSDSTRAFQAAVIEAYGPPGGTEFERVPFIQAFKVACTGHRDRLPVHYPRTSAAPNPDGESFKWFVANERNDARHALPDIYNDPGLPLLDAPQAGRGGRR